MDKKEKNLINLVKFLTKTLSVIEKHVVESHEDCRDFDEILMETPKLLLDLFSSNVKNRQFVTLDKKSVNLPTLPTEIITKIIKFAIADGNQNYLLEFALVNKRWSNLSRELLFHLIIIDNENIIPLIIGLESNNNYKKYNTNWFFPNTKKICLSDSLNYTSWLPFCELTAHLATSSSFFSNITSFESYISLPISSILTVTYNCSNLNSLLLNFIDFSEFNARDLNVKNLTVFKNLKNFRFYDVIGDALKFFNLAALENLEELNITLTSMKMAKIFSKYMEKMKVLKIVFTHEETSESYFLEILSFYEKILNIEELSLSGRFQERLIINCLIKRNLKHLKKILIWKKIKFKENFNLILRNFKNLAYIQADFDEELDDFILEEFCYSLNLIEFRGKFHSSNNLTSAAVNTLCLTLSNLKVFLGTKFNPEIASVFKKFKVLS